MCHCAYMRFQKLLPSIFSDPLTHRLWMVLIIHLLDASACLPHVRLQPCHTAWHEKRHGACGASAVEVVSRTWLAGCMRSGVDLPDAVARRQLPPLSAHAAELGQHGCIRHAATQEASSGPSILPLHGRLVRPGLMQNLDNLTTPARQRISWGCKFRRIKGCNSPLIGS